jgi:hypothetical protein
MYSKHLVRVPLFNTLSVTLPLSFHIVLLQGLLYDSKDILEWLMSQKSVMPRLNSRVFNLDDADYLDFTRNASKLFTHFIVMCITAVFNS